MKIRLQLSEFFLHDKTVQNSSSMKRFQSIQTFLFYFLFHRYFHKMVYDFEGRMEQYRQQIEEMESHLVSLNQPSMITPQGMFYWFSTRRGQRCEQMSMFFST